MVLNIEVVWNVTVDRLSLTDNSPYQHQDTRGARLHPRPSSSPRWKDMIVVDRRIGIVSNPALRAIPHPALAQRSRFRSCVNAGIMCGRLLDRILNHPPNPPTDLAIHPDSHPPTHPSTQRHVCSPRSLFTNTGGSPGPADIFPPFSLSSVCVGCVLRC